MNWKDNLEHLYITGGIQTDSDVRDFADIYGEPYSIVSKYLDELQAEGSRCQGCQYISMHGMYPCNNCGRAKEDKYSLSDEAKRSNWFQQRCQEIKGWIDTRVENSCCTKCYFYVTVPSKSYSVHITEVPILKKVIKMAEAVGIKTTFCDTIEGAFNLNRDWIEIGPMDCGVEFCGVYPITWNIEDVVEFEMMENSGQIIVQVFWVDSEGKFIPNH